MDYSTFDMTFTDRELEDFLSLIQQQEVGSTDMDHTASSSGLPLQFANGIPANVGLQLQPRTLKPGEDLVYSHSSPVSAASSDEGGFVSNSQGYKADVSQSQPSNGMAANSMYNQVPVKAEDVVFSVGPVAMATDSPSLLAVDSGSCTNHNGVAANSAHAQSALASSVPGHPNTQFLSPVNPYGLQLKQDSPALVSQVSGVSGGGDLMGPNGKAAMSAAAFAAAMDPKQNISHSSVEKQRRDRLNSLIDELSNLVPPSNPKYANEGVTVRRPKHVILSDTINLLKHMQDKLKLDEEQLETLKQYSARPTNSGTSSGNGDAPLELPVPPQNSPLATGVIVEHGKERDCLYVKVNCRDRRGLLGDIVLALKMLPLVICTAAVTTTKDGNVCDVFEVRLDDESVTAEDIQCAVHAALYSRGATSSGKRVRNEVLGA